mmetsp:Transcript_8288/g.28190  ORF Transcript_8288/g.28190 Transcript_8288/m.28190 type:complete len:286 (+) Transcript_8288:297-1154(+)
MWRAAPSAGRRWQQLPGAAVPLAPLTTRVTTKWAEWKVCRWGMLPTPPSAQSPPAARLPRGRAVARAHAAGSPPQAGRRRAPVSMLRRAHGVPAGSSVKGGVRAWQAPHQYVSVMADSAATRHEDAAKRWPAPRFHDDDLRSAAALPAGAYALRAQHPRHVMVPALYLFGDASVVYACPFCSSARSGRGTFHVVTHRHGANVDDEQWARMQATGEVLVETRFPHCRATHPPAHLVLVIISSSTPRLRTRSQERRVLRAARLAVADTLAASPQATTSAPSWPPRPA